jgi:porphobilinogen synthase
MLVYPVFVTRRTADSKIAGFAPNKQWGMGEDGEFNTLVAHLEPLMKLGLGSIMLFGVVDESEKDERGASADAERNPVILCLAALAKALPTLQLMCDVCLCEYTDHGHCGSMLSPNVIDNCDSVDRLSEIAVSYAKAGAHWVCPSDMMDGRIGGIRAALDKDPHTRHVAILSYTSKKASAMYAPFRAAVVSCALLCGFIHVIYVV